MREQDKAEIINKMKETAEFKSLGKVQQSILTSPVYVYYVARAVNLMYRRFDDVCNVIINHKSMCDFKPTILSTSKTLFSEGKKYDV